MQGQNVALKNREEWCIISELCSIPPNSEAFTTNVHICHLRVAIYTAALLESMAGSLTT